MTLSLSVIYGLASAVTEFRVQASTLTVLVIVSLIFLYRRLSGKKAEESEVASLMVRPVHCHFACVHACSIERCILSMFYSTV